MSERVHSLLASLPIQWLTAHGAPLPEQAAIADGQLGTSISRATQYALLEAVVARGGESALLALGQGVTQLHSEPLLFLMLNARSVTDFLDKEQRFGSFFHSHHRVRVVANRRNYVLLEHKAEHGTPHRLESLYVLGLHLAMFKALGATQLEARLPNSAEPDLALPTPKGRLPAGAANHWRISWQDLKPPREPLAGLDELLVDIGQPEDLSKPVNIVERVQQAINSQLAQRWSLVEMAKQLHISPRTLQRELQAKGLTFSKLVDSTRVQASAAMLRDGEQSITEVGYACGFADAAHFSRRFRAHFGVSPRAWRNQTSAPEQG